MDTKLNIPNKPVALVLLPEMPHHVLIVAQKTMFPQTMFGDPTRSTLLILTSVPSFQQAAIGLIIILGTYPPVLTHL